MRYRTIHCKVWNDDKFPFLPDDVKLVFFHVLTSPMSTPFGLFKASIGALADEMRWDSKRYANAFREALTKGFFKFDEKALLIFIPKYLKYNPPSNPNVLKSWSKLYSDLPDSPLKTVFYETLKALLEGYGEAFREAFAKGFGKGMPIQDQDQEQYLNTLSSKLDDAPSSKPKPPYQDIIAYLNEKTGKGFKASTGATRSLINARWAEGYRKEDFQRVIDTKSTQWLGNEQEKFLRPQTLFGPKFEAYLNENGRKQGRQPDLPMPEPEGLDLSGHDYGVN